MTGSLADADDLVQETFVRAMARPPARTEEPLRPWLVRVAVNLGRDALRKRKRRAYVGPWLPSPIETDELGAVELEGEGGTEGRYDRLESVSFAFLLALEVLTPNQRAVLLLLRDVFDRSVRETAAALGISEANVKVIHHRARQALAPYEAERAQTRPTPEVARSAAATLQRFVAALAAGDESALASLFAEGVEAWSDGAREFLASRRVVGSARLVAKMYLGLAKKTSPVERVAFRMLNGVPALVAERTAHPGEAARFVIACDVDTEGRIVRLYNVLATKKLSAVGAVGAVGS